MKSNKIKFYDKLEFKYFLEAYKRAIKTKPNRCEKLLFMQDLEVILTNLIESIKDNTYHLGEYTSFVIYEPKKRIIRKLPFIDRVVHQWYVEEFIKPYFIPRFINDSYACIKDRGTLKAVLNVKKDMKIVSRKYSTYYIVKMDIHKYFDSIDKEILFIILKRVIKDKLLLSFSYKLIYENNEERGLAIGSLCSQYFGNIYLNELDRYVKFNLKIKYYTRYLDDFIIFTESKDNAVKVYKLIKIFLINKLRLELNPKSNYFKSGFGVDFCGYKIHPDYLLIRRRNIKKIKLKIRLYNIGYNINIYTSFNGFYSYAKHGKSYKLLKKIYNSININLILFILIKLFHIFKI